MMEDSGIDSDPKQPTVSYFGESAFAKVRTALEWHWANSIMQISQKTFNSMTFVYVAVNRQW